MTKNDLTNAVIKYTLTAKNDLEFDVLNIFVDHLDEIDQFVKEVMAKKTTRWALWNITRYQDMDDFYDKHKVMIVKIIDALEKMGDIEKDNGIRNKKYYACIVFEWIAWQIFKNTKIEQ